LKVVRGPKSWTTESIELFAEEYGYGNNKNPNKAYVLQKTIACMNKKCNATITLHKNKPNERKLHKEDCTYARFNKKIL
jgi:hypothetical protein